MTDEPVALPDPSDEPDDHPDPIDEEAAEIDARDPDAPEEIHELIEQADLPERDVRP